ncbi:30S ribosomal protein S5 [candidate division WS5 bacterium]|uniref:Small ribosomal subunit protein uS5 n=1 Tax=candidate division WS5 bacterium TaxID=2093353 RepID=A0A419DAB2_9BACT|nr:MAG: 30S ribosomal protein S5 [candidate division WS5 bacterium]
MADMKKKFEREPKEFDERVVQIDRVTRVVKGGRRLRFRATVVIGDKKGRVGVGVAKGSQVVLAITKAVAQAKKNLVYINLHETTIPHEVEHVFCGARVFLKPASPGTGVIAGGAVRAVVEVVGIKDILSKMIGSSNKVNNVYAAFEALQSLQAREETKKKEIKAKAPEKKEEKADTKKETVKRKTAKKTVKEVKKHESK